MVDVPFATCVYRNVNRNCLFTLSVMWMLIDLGCFCLNTGYMLIDHLCHVMLLRLLSHPLVVPSRRSRSGSPFLQQHRPPRKFCISGSPIHQLEVPELPRKQIEFIRYYFIYHYYYYYHHDCYYVFNHYSYYCY